MHNFILFHYHNLEIPKGKNFYWIFTAFCYVFMTLNKLHIMHLSMLNWLNAIQVIFFSNWIDICLLLKLFLDILYITVISYSKTFQYVEVPYGEVTVWYSLIGIPTTTQPTLTALGLSLYLLDGLYAYSLTVTSIFKARRDLVGEITYRWVQENGSTSTGWYNKSEVQCGIYW